MRNKHVLRRVFPALLYWFSGFVSSCVASFFSVHTQPVGFDIIVANSFVWPLYLPLTTLSVIGSKELLYPTVFYVGFCIGWVLLASSFIRFDLWKIRVGLRTASFFLINLFTLDIVVRSLWV